MKKFTLIASILTCSVGAIWMCATLLMAPQPAAESLTRSEKLPVEQAQREAQPLLEADSNTLASRGAPDSEASTTARGTDAQKQSFQAKYGHMSRLELEVALGGLSPIRRALQKSILDARREAGLYTEINVPLGTAINPRDYMTEAEKALPNPSGAFSGSLRGGTRNGVPYRELITIPPGTYPDFDALQAEELWLHDAIRKLQE